MISFSNKLIIVLYIDPPIGRWQTIKGTNFDVMGVSIETPIYQDLVCV